MKASHFEIQRYPTIKVFAPGRKNKGSVSDYTGGRTAGDIVAWAIEQLAENIPAPEIQQVCSLSTNLYFIYIHYYLYRLPKVNLSKAAATKNLYALSPYFLIS